MNFSVGAAAAKRNFVKMSSRISNDDDDKANPLNDLLNIRRFVNKIFYKICGY